MNSTQYPPIDFLVNRPHPSSSQHPGSKRKEHREWRLGNISEQGSRGQGQEIANRIENEPLPASSGSGVDGHLLMRWEEWAKALWKRYGDDLLRRENDIESWAYSAGYKRPSRTAVTLLDNVANRHALFADEVPKPTFPYPRNRVEIPMSKSGRLDVSIADYNRFAYFLQNKQPRTTLKATTVAVSPFPKTSSIIVTPKTSNIAVPMWEAVAGPIIATSSRRFDANYVVYSRSQDWAVETLTDEIKEWLLQGPDVRLMADRDSLVCIHLSGWSPVAYLDEFADLAFYFSKAARQAAGLVQ